MATRFSAEALATRCVLRACDSTRGSAASQRSPANRRESSTHRRSHLSAGDCSRRVGVAAEGHHMDRPSNFGGLRPKSFRDALEQPDPRREVRERLGSQPVLQQRTERACAIVITRKPVRQLDGVDRERNRSTKTRFTLGADRSWAGSRDGASAKPRARWRLRSPRKSTRSSGRSSS